MEAIRKNIQLPKDQQRYAQTVQALNKCRKDSYRDDERVQDQIISPSTLDDKLWKRKRQMQYHDVSQLILQPQSC